MAVRAFAGSADAGYAFHHWIGGGSGVIRGIPVLISRNRPNWHIICVTVRGMNNAVLLVAGKRIDQGDGNDR